MFRKLPPLRGERFDGIHEAIVDRELWDEVEARLKSVSRKPPEERRASNPALLSGLVKCGHCGDSLSYTWTHKGATGVKYGYYSCRKDMKRGISTCPVRAVASQLIEPLVEAEAIKFLQTPTMTAALADERRAAPHEIRRMLENPDELWNSTSPAAKHELLRRLIESVTVYEGSIDIKLKTGGDRRLIEEVKNVHSGN